MDLLPLALQAYSGDHEARLVLADALEERNEVEEASLWRNAQVVRRAFTSTNYFVRVIQGSSVTIWANGFRVHFKVGDSLPNQVERPWHVILRAVGPKQIRIANRRLTYCKFISWLFSRGIISKSDLNQTGLKGE